MSSTRNSYPWESWEDGRWHRVRREDVPKTFREILSNHARRHDRVVGIQRAQNGDVLFRFGRELRDGKFIAVDGSEHPFVDEQPKEAERRNW